jgi:hypothetical protein
MTWQYIAGFFDGEGSVLRQGTGYRIVIPQTDERVLQEIKAFVGSGRVSSITKRREHWKDSWIYYIARQRDVLPFLDAIAPLVIVKRSIIVRTLPKLRKIVARQITTEKTMLVNHDRAAELRKRGLTYRAIGKEIGLSWSHVRRLLLKRHADDHRAMAKP